jgi:hypothetical protein
MIYFSVQSDLLVFKRLHTLLVVILRWSMAVSSVSRLGYGIGYSADASVDAVSVSGSTNTSVTNARTLPVHFSLL